MADQHSTAAHSDVIAAQMTELFDALTLIQSARDIDLDAEDAHGITSPRDRLDSLLHMAQAKLRTTIGAFDAVN